MLGIVQGIGLSATELQKEADDARKRPAQEPGRLIPCPRRQPPCQSNGPRRCSEVTST